LLGLFFGSFESTSTSRLVVETGAQRDTSVTHSWEHSVREISWPLSIIFGVPLLESKKRRVFRCIPAPIVSGIGGWRCNPWPKTISF